LEAAPEADTMRCRGPTRPEQTWPESPCPLCGYRILPAEITHLNSWQIVCPRFQAWMCWVKNRSRSLEGIRSRHRRTLLVKGTRATKNRWIRREFETRLQLTDQPVFQAQVCQFWLS